jgi:vacuolar-type H+-ATPase subunit H
LSRNDRIATQQSRALLEEIERQTEDECRTIVDAAEREGGALVAQAHAAASRRMHEAIQELRREGRKRRARVKAQRETEARKQLQRQDAEMVRQTWPMLVAALAARWRDPSARMVWVNGATRQARERLRDPPTHDTASRDKPSCDKIWRIEHPADWSADEQEHLRKALGTADGAHIAFIVDHKLDAGLRICLENAMLDATPRGLLADEIAIAGLLLGELSQGAGR